MSRSRKGWRPVKFGEVVRLVTDRCDPVVERIERFVGLEHLEPGSLRVRSWGTVAGGTTFTSRFRPGQLLFGKRRAYQRKVAVADFEGVCSGDIYVLESRDPATLQPELLPFLCQTDDFFEHAVGTSAGSLSPRTNWTRLAEYQFALPPPEEQLRIARQLSACGTMVETLRDALMAQSRAARSLIVNTFRPDRGVRDRFPPHWRSAPTAAVGDVQLGQQRHPMFETGSNMRPYLRVANVLDSKLDLSDVLAMHFPTENLARFELKPGDILLNEGQSTELVGRSAIYRGEIPGACFQKTLLRYRCGPDLVPEFAQAYFRHMLYTGQFARAAVQTTSMAHLTGVRFAAMVIPIPPRAEQEAVVVQLSAIAAAERALVSRTEAAVAHLRLMLRFVTRH